jgi:TatA/E family protein of Tat protein translocase
MPILPGLGLTEILIVILIIIVLLNPSVLPRLAKAIGLSVREFKKSWKGVQVEKETKEKVSTVRELAEKLGIDTEGKRDEEIAKEIERIIRREK